MKSLIKSWFIAFLAIPALVAPAQGLGLGSSFGSGLAKTQVRLLLSADAVKAGSAVMAGIELKMPKGWHTYWRNPGDSGLPTKVEWTLPEGVTAGDILWPVPEKHEVAGITTFDYDDEVVLLVPLKIAPSAKGELELKAKISWLECEKSCIPGKTEVSVVLTNAPNTHPSVDAARLLDWSEKVPQPKPETKLNARWEGAAAGDSRSLLIEWDAGAGLQSADFFPYSTNKFEVAAATEIASTNGPTRLRKKVTKLEGDWPKEITGVVVMSRTAGGPREAFEATVLIRQSAAANNSPAGRIVGGTASPALVAMLGFAFLGGLILNFMPCVLPVIALKVLGFVQQSKESPGLVKKMGLSYSFGVLCSFVALAIMVIAAQHAGGLASWGMQMQNPHFRVAMTVVVLLVALNLFGLFEVTLSGSAMGAADQLASREGYGGAFFNGVLATALATPCTAPFLTVALGFAFTQSPTIILLMFAATAIGLAAPYLVLSWQPGWLRFLPKPGVWMQHFKVAMGFPMLATAIWLFDLSAGSFGEGGPLWLGLFLVTLALTAWIWGQFVQRGTKRKGLAIAACVILLGGGYLYALENELHWRTPAKRSAFGSYKSKPNGIEWLPWSVAAIEQAREEGHPVLVDFTAKWCLTCDLNSRTSLEIPSVRQKLKELNVVTLIGDNTDESPDIAAELRNYGRAGVPLVLVFPKDKTKPALVLPALLTPSIVLSALDEAAQ